MAKWKVLQVTANGGHIDAAERVWASIGAIEITCIYFLYEAKAHKSSV